MVTKHFQWSQLGNVQEDRPNLGGDTKVAAYRLMHSSLRAVLMKNFGVVWVEFCRNLLDAGLPFAAREVDCWSTGERTCRFTSEPVL